MVNNTTLSSQRAIRLWDADVHRLADLHISRIPKFESFYTSFTVDFDDEQIAEQAFWLEAIEALGRETFEVRPNPHLYANRSDFKSIGVPNLLLSEWNLDNPVSLQEIIGFAGTLYKQPPHHVHALTVGEVAYAFARDRIRFMMSFDPWASPQFESIMGTSSTMISGEQSWWSVPSLSRLTVDLRRCATDEDEKYDTGIWLWLAFFLVANDAASFKGVLTQAGNMNDLTTPEVNLVFERVSGLRHLDYAQVLPLLTAGFYDVESILNTIQNGVDADFAVAAFSS